MEYMKEFEKLPRELNKWANTAVSKIEARPIRQAEARRIKKEINDLLKKYKNLDEKEQIKTILEELGNAKEVAEQLRKNEIYNPATNLKYRVFAILLIFFGALLTAYPILVLVHPGFASYSVFVDRKQTISALTSGITMLILGVWAWRVSSRYSENKKNL